MVLYSKAKAYIKHITESFNYQITYGIPALGLTYIPDLPPADNMLGYFALMELTFQGDISNKACSRHLKS